MRKRPTGEPDAGNPHVRFGGEGASAPLPNRYASGVCGPGKLQVCQLRDALQGVFAAGKERCLRSTYRDAARGHRWSSTGVPDPGKHRLLHDYKKIAHLGDALYGVSRVDSQRAGEASRLSVRGSAGLT